MQRQSIRNHRDLIVWQRSMELLTAAYAIARRLPVDERYALGAQLRRAAVSVPANIAEGHARASRREYAHHLSIARGSTAEVDTLLEACHALHYAGRSDPLRALDHVDQVRRMPTAMIGRMRDEAR